MLDYVEIENTTKKINESIDVYMTTRYVWRSLKSIWLIILILKMFSESIWLQDEIVQEKWEQPKTRAFGEVLKLSTEKLYISDQIRWKWIKWLMIMQSRLRKFINLLANMIVSMLLLFMMMSKCKHKESLFLKHILNCPFQTKYSWPRIKGPSFSFFLENHIIDLMLNVEDESEHHFGDENRRCALSELPMFLVKYFWVTI